MQALSAPASEAEKPDFWAYLDQLVESTTVVIDRPRGSHHLRFPEQVYPLDYGYLWETRANDGAGIDVWIGTEAERRITGVVITVDLEKRDAEIKVLLGCTPDDARTVLDVHSRGTQAATLLMRHSTFDDADPRTNVYPPDRQEGPC